MGPFRVNDMSIKIITVNKFTNKQKKLLWKKKHEIIIIIIKIATNKMNESRMSFSWQYMIN